jgi:hypothetical protein
MQKQSTVLDFKGQNFYVGIDVHLKSWTVTILTEELMHKTFTQPPSAEALFNKSVSYYISCFANNLLYATKTNQ